MISVMVAALLSADCHADSLFGIWQTETTHGSAPGRNNTGAGFETIEFFKDSSFQISDVVTIDGKRWTNVPFSGTYQLIGTNQASLKVIPHDIAPGSTPPSLTVSCSIVGKELVIPKFIPSVVPDYKKYRRVK